MMTQLEAQTCKKGEILFRQGEDSGGCMYQILWGTVGIYVDYGTRKEWQAARLHAEQFFGEMGLIEGGPRTATAVVLEANTRIQRITKESFHDCFKGRPGKVFMFMQHMSRRIRWTTKDYLAACKTVADAVEARERGETLGSETQERLHRLAERYRQSR